MKLISLPKRARSPPQELNQIIFEREEVIDGILTAILTKTHIALIGKWGSAKSMLVGQIAKAFSNLTLFETLGHEQTPPADLLGAVDLLHWRNSGEYKIKCDRHLPNAHLANIEEIFNLPPSLLHALHRITNERIFYNPDPTDCPLITLIGSANQLPDKKAWAFFDRIHQRYLIDYLCNTSNKKRMIRNIADGVKTEVTVGITLTELEQMHEEVKQLAFPESVEDSLISLQEKILEQVGLHISDRRLGVMVNILKGYAYLCGDSEVTTEHFAILPSVLWEAPTQIQEIRKICNTFASPLKIKIQELVNVATEESQNLGVCPTSEADQSQWTQQAGWTAKNLAGVLKELEELKTSTQNKRSHTQINRAIAKVEELRNPILAQLSKTFELTISSHN